MADPVGTPKDFTTQKLRVYGQYTNTMVKLDKQRENGDLCDAILEAEERQFPIHRAVLSTSSSYFETMWDKNKVSVVNKIVVQLNGVRADILEIILNGIYRGELEFEIEDMLDVAAMCDCYNIPEFMKEIHNAALLIMNHKQDRARYTYLFDMHTMASLYSWTDVRLLCEKGIQENFSSLCLWINWENIAYRQMLVLVQREDIYAEDEDCFINAVLTWIKYNPTERSQYAEDLMENVRFPLLSSAKIYSLQHESIISESKKCTIWLEEATKFWLEANNRKILRKKSSTFSVVNCDGIKYRPRQTLNDTVLYAILDSSDLRAYYPKYNSWYSLSTLDEPKEYSNMDVSNASGSIVYVLHYNIEEIVDSHGPVLQMYNCLRNTWSHCRPPTENPKRIINCSGNLVGFTESGIICYNPDHDNWSDLSVQIGDPDGYNFKFAFDENPRVWCTPDSNVLIYNGYLWFKLDPVTGHITKLAERMRNDFYQAEGRELLTDSKIFFKYYSDCGISMSLACFMNDKSLEMPSRLEIVKIVYRDILPAYYFADENKKKLHVLNSESGDEMDGTSGDSVANLMAMSFATYNGTKSERFASLQLSKVKLEKACFVVAINAADTFD